MYDDRIGSTDFAIVSKVVYVSAMLVWSVCLSLRSTSAPAAVGPLHSDPVIRGVVLDPSYYEREEVRKK